MSYHVFFDFSSGLNGPMIAPKGTLKSILDHVASVEETLGLETTQYKDNPKRWKSTEPTIEVDNETYCETAKEHNDFVRGLYHAMAAWSENPPVDGETITPEQAATFWHALRTITVPPERWTREYYTDRMEHLYEAMRGRESEGVTFDEKPLTSRQAAQVINLFSAYLDTHDCRLDVPKGHDYLASSYDGGYVWCEKCGAVTDDHAAECRKRGCPLRDDYR